MRKLTTMSIWRGFPDAVWIGRLGLVPAPPQLFSVKSSGVSLGWVRPFSQLHLACKL